MTTGKEKSDNSRRMPERVDLGRSFTTTMSLPMGQLREYKERPHEMNPHGLRTVMGYCLPTWQRGLVWTVAQKIAFIESAWRGVNLGSFTFNQLTPGHPLDNLLIDGQQRMSAIESYLKDEFPVFGWRWSEVTVVDKRMWGMTVVFPSFITASEDEGYLRSYYDLMNFSGTAHRENERASRATAAPANDSIEGKIAAAARSVGRLDLRVLQYDLSDGGEAAYSISGLEPSHIGDAALEADLRKLVELAQELGICIQTEIDVASDPNGADADLSIMDPQAAAAMRTWLTEVGFSVLGPTQLGLGERFGVDARPAPVLSPR